MFSLKIGIVSDTHLTSRTSKLPHALAKGLRGVDLILHAGDWISSHVYDLFCEIAPCDGVAGNNDGVDLIERFGKKKIIDCAGYRIGIVHGHGYHQVTEISARIAFLQEKPDVIIFGHSHVPFHSINDGILQFNPGSPTDKRRQQRYSYGIFEINQGIRAWHEFYENKD